MNATTTSTTDELAEKLWRDYDGTMRSVARLATEGASSGNLGRRRYAEQRLGQAYQALVKAGLARQIRGKYRHG